MKKTLFLFMATAMVTLLTSCGVNPVEFNDKLVDIQDSIMTEIQTISTNVATDDKAGLQTQTDAFIKKVDAKIAEINGLEKPEGGEEFANTLIDAFEMYKKVAVKINEGANLSEENVDEYNKYIDEFNKMIEEGDAAENKFLEAQKVYAKAHNMLLK